MNKPRNKFNPACPIPRSDYPFITMAHGSGGKLMHQLIDKIFKTAFGDVALQADHDGAVLDSPDSKLVMTTDSYVVQPLFFPGGDIGTLAINGTVNDLAMCGARPLYLSVGFILEEGLPIETLWQVALSIRQAAEDADIRIVTGDTKVVDKGKGDRIYINTAGVGQLINDIKISPANIQPGDAIIINGDIGRHAIAVLSQREGLSFETNIESDCQPLAQAVKNLLDAKVEIHCLRDLTRGGLATALVEISQSAKFDIVIDEASIPVSPPVEAACGILGFDPIYLANEGRFIAFVNPDYINKALSILSSLGGDFKPALIGQVDQTRNNMVTLKSKIGSERIIDMLSGDQFPRIC
jgi:hydrogenase expression/formation protein HypE